MSRSSKLYLEVQWYLFVFTETKSESVMRTNRVMSKLAQKNCLIRLAHTSVVGSLYSYCFLSRIVLSQYELAGMLTRGEKRRKKKMTQFSTRPVSTLSLFNVSNYYGSPS